MAITPQQTLFAITEAHPETIAVFVAQGYENMGDADKRRTQGKMVTLAQAVQARGKDLASFTALLENAVREAGATPDLTLAEDADESQVFPSEGDIRVAGLLPCPVRIPLLEAFDKVVAEVRQESGLTVGRKLVAASVGADVLEEGMRSIEDESDLPDIFLSAGFEAFFDRRNMARFRDQGVFQDTTWPAHNPLLAPYGLKDPDGHYAMLAVVPAVFLVDRTQLAEGEAVPRTWREILGPRFAGKIAMPVGDFDLFNGILLTIWKYFGDEGVEAIGRNLLAGMHPSQAAGRFAPRGGKGPLVSVIPYFFSKMAQFNPDAEIVWPEDGAVISPIFMLTKRTASEQVRKLADFFAGREAGEILSHKGLFPSCHPEVQNPVPEEAPFLWLGWDFIKEHDLGELIPRVNDIFGKAAN
ncbi:iron ABC transporter substrate-binding protein [bacterium DOLZORAL124_64_63]|nr:MAG: iron ABC transporter substrate-binding protein [bacterium DOLZORAL124_64_63]